MQMLVEPVTRLETPDASERLASAPSDTRYVSSPPLTTELPSTYSIRIAAQPVPATPLPTPLPASPAPVTLAAPVAVPSAPLATAMPCTQLFRPSTMTPAPSNFSPWFQQDFHFTAEPQSPSSPVLHERRPLSRNLQGMVAEVERLAMNQEQLRQDFDQLKRVAWSQNEALEGLRRRQPEPAAAQRAAAPRAEARMPKMGKEKVTVTEKSKGWDESVADCLLCGK